MSDACTHLDQIQAVTPSAATCLSDSRLYEVE
jgi:hypothetical protein